MTSKIRRQGGAAVLTIPPVLLKQMNLGVGAQVALSIEDGSLVLRPAVPARKRYSLAELLDGAELMTALNADVAWARDGDPVGHEIA